jgi:hypothetical protein
MTSNPLHTVLRHTPHFLPRLGETSAAEHRTLREGVILGAIVAIVTWVWIALVDIVSGDALRTPSALGGVVAFTAGHCVLNVLYAVALVTMIHAAVQEPNLIMAALITVAMIEIGFIMLTAVLSHFLGGLAWVAMLLLARTHPLGHLLHRAETER